LEALRNAQVKEVQVKDTTPERFASRTAGSKVNHDDRGLYRILIFWEMGKRVCGPSSSAASGAAYEPTENHVQQLACLQLAEQACSPLATVKHSVADSH